MAMKRCDADLHFYDTSKEPSCPYCRDQGEEFDETVAANLKSGLGVDDNSGKTVGIHTFKSDQNNTSADIDSPADDDGLTQAYFPREEGYDPVVGWLVCVDGAAKGRDFRIKTGINEIGRDASKDVEIVITGDTLISRRDHAEIEYDHDENAFYLIRKKNQAVKLNNKNVRQPTQLDPFDTIIFGQSTFIFVPFCTEKFKWSVQQ